jgi:hypothetical protein
MEELYQDSLTIVKKFIFELQTEEYIEKYMKDANFRRELIDKLNCMLVLLSDKEAILRDQLKDITNRIQVIHATYELVGVEFKYSAGAPNGRRTGKWS